MKTPPLKSALNIFAVFVLALALVLQAAFVPSVSAASQILNRSLTLQAGATDGGSLPSGVVKHYFQFTLPTAAITQSIKFEYCTAAANSLANPACVKPTGLTTTSATLGSEAGSAVAGFTMVNATDGAPYLTRTAGSPISANSDVKLRLDSITNPSTVGPFFVRITSYPTTNTSGAATDAGTVTAATNEPIVLDGTMPESLVFCTGADILKTSGVPDCSTATSGAITFDQLFSPTDTASAVSKMAASTNAGFGYAISVNGPTLTSGSNHINGLGSPTASLKGIAQFGLNLRADTAAAAPGFPGTGSTASSEIDLTSDGVNLNGRPTTNYATIDNFTFNTGDVVADSNFNTAGSADPSDAQIYTVSYIANVPGSQPAGTYTTTLTYICTPTF